MQITDMQEIPAISKDTIALMERAVLEEQPDLVVYTGDQIKGYGVTYKGKGEELEREVAQTIGKLLEPVTKRGIPFAVTFGNHDCQVVPSAVSLSSTGIYSPRPLGCICKGFTP